MKTPSNVQTRVETSTISVRSYVEVRPKQSPDIYKIRKCYVGRLKELPPPQVIREKWNCDVREGLENHLCQATSTLSTSMRDDEIIIELVLCMAGKKCSPEAVAMYGVNSCPKDPVILKPAVWIHCGSKKCKKKVGVPMMLMFIIKGIDGELGRRSYSKLNIPQALHSPLPYGITVYFIIRALAGNSRRITGSPHVARNSSKY